MKLIKGTAENKSPKFYKTRKVGKNLNNKSKLNIKN